jgi:hypothetical protein
VGTDSGDDTSDWTEQSGKALAAGVGALVGLPFGPAGLVGGAVAGPLLEPVAIEILQRVGRAGRRRGGEALAVACEVTELSPEELLARISDDEKLQILAGMAISAAARTAWEDKVLTIGRSLASGLLASDDAEVDTEQLIMSAIADMEAPHVALLDLLVAWRPPISDDEDLPVKLDIPEYSYAVLHEHTWHAGRRKWYRDVIETYRPRLAPILPELMGTLQRHGLVVYQNDPSDAVERLGVHFGRRRKAMEERQLTEHRVRRLYNHESISSVTEMWEPSELGEQVWIHFHKAGANVPDVWSKVREDSNVTPSDPSAPTA